MNETNKIWLIALTALVLGMTLATGEPLTFPGYPLDVNINLSGYHIYDSQAEGLQDNVTIRDNLSMGPPDHRVRRVNLPRRPGDAINYRYGNRSYLNRDGTESMNATLDMGNNTMLNIGGIPKCWSESALTGNGSCKHVVTDFADLLDHGNSAGDYDLNMNNQVIKEVGGLPQCKVCVRSRGTETHCSFEGEGYSSTITISKDGSIIDGGGDQDISFKLECMGGEDDSDGDTDLTCVDECDPSTYETTCLGSEEVYCGDVDGDDCYEIATRPSGACDGDGELQ